MDRIIEQVRKVDHGYKMGEQHLKIICYADDATLFAETEDGLQWLLQAFKKEADNLNMEISTSKTKSMVIAREPVRCKLQLSSKIIDQVFEFNYLGTAISPYGDLKNCVRRQPE